MGVHLRGDLLPLHGFAVESVVDRLAEGLPQLLFQLAIQGHRLRFGLPALLQDLDRVHTQTRGCAQNLGFGDQRLTPL